MSTNDHNRRTARGYPNGHPYYTTGDFDTITADAYKVGFGPTEAKPVHYAIKGINGEVILISYISKHGRLVLLPKIWKPCFASYTSDDR